MNDLSFIQVYSYLFIMFNNIYNLKLYNISYISILITYILYSQALLLYIYIYIYIHPLLNRLYGL